jgi:hypothetical protein
MLRRDTMLSCYRMMHRDHWPTKAICPPLSKTRLWSETKWKYFQFICCLRLSWNSLAVFSHSFALKYHPLLVLRRGTLADSWKREWNRYPKWGPFTDSTHIHWNSQLNVGRHTVDGCLKYEILPAVRQWMNPWQPERNKMGSTRVLPTFHI